MNINIENNKNFSINYKIDDRKFVEIKFDENGNIGINEKYYNEQKKTEDLIDKLNLNSEQLKRIKNINETLDRKPEIEEKPKQTVKELTQEIKSIFNGETKKDEFTSFDKVVKMRQRKDILDKSLESITKKIRPISKFDSMVDRIAEEKLEKEQFKEYKADLPYNERPIDWVIRENKDDGKGE